MLDQVATVGATALSAVPPLTSAIDDKVILDWCFIIGALDLGAVGFLYNTYATAKFSDRHPPPIAKYLCKFIRALTFVLTVLTGIALATAYSAKVSIAVWLIVACLAFVTFWCIGLAWNLS